MTHDRDLFGPELHCLYASWYAAVGDQSRVDEELELAAVSALNIAQALAITSSERELDAPGPTDPPAAKLRTLKR
jgi:hypothetical protein